MSFRKYSFTVFLFLIVTFVFMYTIIDKMDFLFYDDAFYYLDMVNDGNIFSPTTDGMNPTTGYHPLWYWLLEFISIFGFIGFKLHVVLTSIVLLFSVYFWYKVFKFITHKKYFSLNFSVLMHLYFPIFLLNYSGIESSLVMMSIGLYLMSIYECTGTWDFHSCKIWKILLTSIILFLSRTDMILIIIPVSIYVLINVHIKDRFIIKRENKLFNKTLKTLIIGIGWVILSYLMFNYLVSGHFFQTSSTVYSSIRWNEVYSLGDYFNKVWEQVKVFNLYVGGALISIVYFLMFVIIARSYDYSNKPLVSFYLYGVILYFMFHAFIRFCFSAWYSIPFYILFCLSICICLYCEKNKYIRTIYICIASFIFIFSLVTISSDMGHKQSEISMFKTWDKADRPLDQISAATKLFQNGYDYKIGAYNSGEFSYYVDDVVNLDGLMNVNIIDAYKKNEGIKYLRDNQIYVIIDSYIYLRIFDYSNLIPLDSFDLVVGTRNAQNKDASVTLVYLLKNSSISRDSVLSMLSKGAKYE